MCKKCPYSELFCSIFSRIRIFITQYLSVISPNAGKYGPEKLPIRTLFTQWKCLNSQFVIKKNTLIFCEGDNDILRYFR